jgi:hypothetical protein
MNECASGQIFVLFRDGHHGWFLRYNYDGPAIVGQPTVYVYRQIGSRMARVWVVPGESVDWIERSCK